jgi:carbon storage regulator CsrA
MLVLCRKNQESVIIGRTSGFAPLLKIRVIESRAGKVWLGFEADADVVIHREEVWERIGAERQTSVPKCVVEGSKYPVPYLD